MPALTATPLTLCDICLNLNKLQLVKKISVITLFIVLSAVLFGCLEATTNSSPKFRDDYNNIESEVNTVSNSEAVSFFDEITTRRNDTVKRQIRIDLVNPKDFTNAKKAKEIAQLVNSRLFETTHIALFKINAVAEQKGDTIIYPNPNILKS